MEHGSKLLRIFFCKKDFLLVSFSSRECLISKIWWHFCSVYDTIRIKKQVGSHRRWCNESSPCRAFLTSNLLAFMKIYPYKQQQNDFLCRFSIVMFISRTMMENTSFTLMRLLADASINGQPHISASAWPIEANIVTWNQNIAFTDLTLFSGNLSLAF